MELNLWRRARYLSSLKPWTSGRFACFSYSGWYHFIFFWNAKDADSDDSDHGDASIPQLRCAWSPKIPGQSQQGLIVLSTSGRFAPKGPTSGYLRLKSWKIVFLVAVRQVLRALGILNILGRIRSKCQRFWDCLSIFEASKLKDLVADMLSFQVLALARPDGFWTWDGFEWCSRAEDILLWDIAHSRHEQCSKPGIIIIQ